MFERGVARPGALVGVAIFVVIACISVGVTAASARHRPHRPGCSARCRQLGGLGSGGPQAPPRMALLRHREHRDSRFVDLRLRCLRQHRPCQGVIMLRAGNSRAPELSRVDLYVPAGRTWTIEARLTRAGLSYLKSHQRVRAFLFLVYRDQVDSFRMTVIG